MSLYISLSLIIIDYVSTPAVDFASAQAACIAPKEGLVNIGSPVKGTIARGTPSKEMLSLTESM